MNLVVGEVVIDVRLAGYFAWNDEIDSARPQVHKSRDAVLKIHGAITPMWRTCTCYGWEACRLFAPIGGGHWWFGTVCMRCMVIVDGLRPDLTNPEVMFKGHPLT